MEDYIDKKDPSRPFKINKGRHQNGYNNQKTYTRPPVEVPETLPSGEPRNSKGGGNRRRRYASTKGFSISNLTNKNNGIRKSKTFKLRSLRGY